jgi:hypothetical protein
MQKENDVFLLVVECVDEHEHVHVVWFVHYERKINSILNNKLFNFRF